MKNEFGILALLVLWVVLATKNVSAQVGQLQITSPAFGHNQMIPQKYTCQGEDVNPPLAITGVPEGTKSFTLIIDDPDAPGGNWDHWLIYNIAPAPIIEEDSVPGTQTTNDFGRVHYGGPCPPSGTHRYFFKLYALDAELSFSGLPSKQELEKAMEGHVLAKAELMGLYQKTKISY